MDLQANLERIESTLRLLTPPHTGDAPALDSNQWLASSAATLGYLKAEFERALRERATIQDAKRKLCHDLRSGARNPQGAALTPAEIAVLTGLRLDTVRAFLNESNPE